MHDSFFDIRQIVILAMLLPTIVLGILIFVRLSSFWRIIYLLTTLAFTVELISRYLNYYHTKNTTPLFNCYILAEQLLLLSAVFMILKPYIMWRISSLILCVMIWLWNINQNGFYTFAQISFLTGCVLIVMFYTALLIALVHNDIEGPVRPLLLVSISTLLYFGGDIPLFCLINYLSTHEHKEFAYKLYSINDVLAICRYLMVFVSFLYIARPTTKKISL